jgi:hypothetical protein
LIARWSRPPVRLEGRGDSTTPNIDTATVSSSLHPIPSHDADRPEAKRVVSVNPPPASLQC